MDGFHFLPTQRNLIGIRPCLSGNGDLLQAQLALGPRLAEQAYQIRYEAYYSFGHLAANDRETFSDRYDSQANCQTCLVFKDGKPVATMRVGVYVPAADGCSAQNLPAMEIFGQEIEQTISSLGRADYVPRVVEVGRLARAPAYAKNIDLVFALFRAAGYLILHHRADIVFNAVRAHHVPMYRRFGFQQLDEPRLYPGLTCKMALMACFRSSYDSARENLPFLRGISTDDEAYAGLVAGERVPMSLQRDSASPDATWRDVARRAG